MTCYGLHFSHRRNTVVVSNHITAGMNVISRPSCVMYSLTSGLTLLIQPDLPCLCSTEALGLDLMSFTHSSLPLCLSFTPSSSHSLSLLCSSLSHFLSFFFFHFHLSHPLSSPSTFLISVPSRPGVEITVFIRTSISLDLSR